MRFDVFTIFPQMFSGFLNESILKRAQQKGLIEIALHNIRDWTTDRHRTVDDTPYGGGPGMVMMAPPIVHAVEDILGADLATTPVILLSPSGDIFTQEVARELVQYPRLALVCGRYEGIDDRVRIILKARELSIGDYVLTGGELAAAVVIDVVSRLVPGVIDPASLAEESHSSGLLEYPQYTRPPVFRGLGVPEVLLSGNHARIAEWRRMMALCRTKVRRPDLLARAPLTPRDRELLEQCPPDPFAHLGPVYDEHAVDERGTVIPTEPRSLLGWLVIGFLAGWIAGLLTRGRGFGCLGNVAVGLVGAVVGGYLFNLLGFRGSAGFLGSLVVAVIGAGVLLVAVNLLRR